ncbi:MAG: phospholipase D-like domain-containing protein [Meiothermus sp.]|uniref:phospholipase D-like domain-containing protein n=1 Tax=Meiothermus sp. TaxID=1955249 RepID=UPI0025EA4B18|nr:phospholipase D-like domain-containing protein [Meiothermus sp.]MCS7058653.1 phospholipase D-like domain-containing protein [Meiothermus sp.]MCS7195245.1 phospholipase D-like domain-containing protein [Meiothermus sp.]MDW8090020.1 phospholipase D-like domain-containing protein [Meiothermus sp.]MDW8480671.1 phospholipase D-like domain-containing protein [Meiothermus sp.]
MQRYPRPTRRRRQREWGAAFLLVGLLVYLLWQNLPQAIPPVYRAEGGLELYFAPQQGPAAKQRLIELLDSAQQQVEVAVLELEDREIGQALLRAAERGVRVRLFVESDYRRELRESLGVPSQSQERCETLRQVAVCYDGRDNALMHHKFVLIDQKGVWTGSSNLTWNAFERNDENSLWLPVEGLVAAYRAEFEALFSGQESGLGHPARFQVGSTQGTVYFSPAGGHQGREAILKVLEGARQEVLVAAYVLTDERVVEALVRAHQRGAEVRVVIDGRNLVNSRTGPLRRAGVDVRQDGNPYTMHHKVMVVDGTWVVTGSYNFTNSAFRRNNENLLVLNGPELAQRYRQEVERIWRAGKPL